MALSNAERGKLMLAVLYLDIDGFKPINDTLGHDVGAILLQSAARWLINHSRHGDTIARMGGDEFTFILNQITSREEASQIAERLVNTFKDPFLINGRNLTATASIGVSLYPDNGEDIQTLIKNADIAMYNAKTSGKNNYKFYV